MPVCRNLLFGRMVAASLLCVILLVEIVANAVIPKFAENLNPIVNIIPNESTSLSVDELFEFQGEALSDQKMTFMATGGSVKVSSITSPAFVSKQDTSDVTGVFAAFSLSPRYSLLLYGTKTLSLLLTELSPESNTIVRMDRFNEANLNSTNVVCLDAFIDEADKKFFVICHETDDGVVPRQIKVIVGDLKSYKILILTSLAQSKVPVPEGCGFQLRQFTNVVSNVNIQALVYWLRCYPVQGKAPALSKQFLVCKIDREFGYTLDCKAEYSFDVTSQQEIGLRSLWDMQELSAGRYILAGGASDPSNPNLILRTCEIDFTNAAAIKISCSEGQHQTGVDENGYLGINSDLSLAEVYLSNSSARICQIDPKLTSTSNWTSSCQYAAKWPLPPSDKPLYVIATIASRAGVFLSLGNSDFSYAGYSASSSDPSRTYWAVVDTTQQVTVHNSRLLTRNPAETSSLGIGFLASPQIILSEQTLGQESTTVKVSANPSTGELTSLQFATTLTRLKGDALKFLGQTYSSRTQDYKFFANSPTPLFKTDIQGSAMTYNMTFLNKTLTGSLGFDADALRRADMSFPRSPKLPQGVPKLSGVYVGDGFLFGFDVNSTMYLFRCTNPLSQNYVCNFKITFKSRSVTLASIRVLRAEAISNQLIFATLEGDTKGNNPRPERIIIVVQASQSLESDWTVNSRYLGYCPFSDSAAYLANTTAGSSPNKGLYALAYNDDDRQGIEIYSFDISSITLESFLPLAKISALSVRGTSGSELVAFTESGEAVTIYGTSIISRESTLGSGLCLTNQGDFVARRSGNTFYLTSSRGEALKLPVDQLGEQTVPNLVCRSSSSFMVAYTNVSTETGPKGTIWLISLDRLWNSNSRVLSKQNFDFPTNLSRLAGVFQLQDRVIVTYQDEFSENFFSEVSITFPGVETGTNKAPSGNYTLPENGEDVVISDLLMTEVTDLYNNTCSTTSPISVMWQNPGIRVSVAQQQQFGSSSEIDMDSMMTFGGHILKTELTGKQDPALKLSQRLQADSKPMITPDRVKFLWSSPTSILGLSQTTYTMRLHTFPIAANTTLPPRKIDVPSPAGTGAVVAAHAATFSDKDVWVYLTEVSPNSPSCILSLASAPSDPSMQSLTQVAAGSWVLSSSVVCTEPKLLLYAASQTLLVSEPLGVGVWGLTFEQNGTPSIIRKGTLPIQADFDIVTLSSTLSAVIGFVSGESKLTATVLFAGIPQKTSSIQLPGNAIGLKTLSCSQVDKTQAYLPITCVGDTYSENIIEFTVQVRGYQNQGGPTFSVPAVYYHLKYALYEPTEVKVTTDYVLATMVSSKSGLKDRVLAGWRRQMNGISRKMIFMELLPSGQTPFLSSVRDFSALAVAWDKQGFWRSFVALPDEVEPKVQAYTLNKLTLSMPKNPASNYQESLSNFALKVTATISSSSVTMSLNHLFVSPSKPKEGGRSSWAYKLLIILGLAIIGVAVYFFYTKYKSSNVEDEYFAANPSTISGKGGKGTGEHSIFNNDTIGSHKQDEIPA